MLTYSYTGFLETLKKNRDNTKKKMLKISLLNSVLALPRDSKSFDVLVLSADKVEVTICKEDRSMYT